MQWIIWTCCNPRQVSVASPIPDWDSQKLLTMLCEPESELVTCGLAWTDINLAECTLMVKRTARYNTSWKCYEIGASTIYFGENLLQILKAAKKQQQRDRLEYGELYSLNYYREVLEKGRTHYEVKSFLIPKEVPAEYREIPFVCTHKDGRYSPKDTVGEACRCAAGKIPGLEGFRFHMLRHTYTNNLLKGGVSPKDVRNF